ncbi:DUF5986 family protein [Sporosarcina beigongshangi]|uniref:DUF5986 family protein n=1 Tax=Sporosarcina beigongshangi TaxID=2782538 RepID=UPI0019398E33|nr:DUF5986 family protein [Sporosarcina beigongshangi]
MKINESVAKDLVQAFSKSTDGTINEIILEHSLDTHNFKDFGAWDIRFSRIKKVALKHELVTLRRKRGRWTFFCILHIETGILYVFSKEKNLESVIKKLGKGSIHYFHAFISKNGDAIDLDNTQTSLFPMLTDEYEEKRLIEVQKILGNEYPLVKKVIFIVGKEENKQIVNVEAHFYNKYFELIDFEDWSSNISLAEYSDLTASITPMDQDSIDDEKPIPSVKQNIKDRKDKDSKKDIQEVVSPKKEEEKEEEN